MALRPTRNFRPLPTKHPAPDPDIDSEDDIFPFDFLPTTRPLRQRSVVYKRPRQPISSRKPPVPPPFVPSSIIMAEEHALPNTTTEPCSPESSFMSSSFLSSEPGSPIKVSRNCNVNAEIARLRAVVKEWDKRLVALEERNKRIEDTVNKLEPATITNTEYNLEDVSIQIEDIDIQPVELGDWCTEGALK